LPPFLALPPTALVFALGLAAPDFTPVAFFPLAPLPSFA
jgi:hypothetical protein